jgi:hypothetical protein
VQFNAFNTSGAGSYTAGPVRIVDNLISNATASAGSGIVVAPSPGRAGAATSIKGVRVVGAVVDELGSSSTAAAIVLSRVYGADVSGNTLKNLHSTGILMTLEGTSYGDSTIVSNNLIEDSIIPSGAYLEIFGPNAIVRGNIARNSTAGIGIQASSPTTIVEANILPGARYAMVNSDTVGHPTAPALQVAGHDGGGQWSFAQPITVPSVLLSQNYTIAGGGTDLSTATPLNAGIVVVAATPAGSGVALPATASWVGGTVKIYNNGRNTLTVYAQGGETIGGAPFIRIASGGVATMTCVHDALWMAG